jgi:ankyrin repeat protein
MLSPLLSSSLLPSSVAFTDILLTPSSQTALMKALRKKREDCALELIRAGARATDKDKKFHNTAIHIAAQKGLAKVLDLLLSSDPSGVHVQNVLQRSPLHEAAAHDHLECCQILLQYGARIDSPKDDNDRTPIEYAQARGHQTLAFEMRRIHVSPTFRPSSLPFLPFPPFFLFLPFLPFLSSLTS